MKYLFFLCVLILVSCMNDNVDSNPRNEDTTLQQKDIKVDSIVKKSEDDTSHVGVLHKKIAGFWALVGEENVSFEINQTHFFYPEFSKSYKYLLQNDSIKIAYDGYDESYLVKLRGKDTLILAGDEEQIFYRFKNN